jgi:hypothetical protein
VAGLFERAGVEAFAWCTGACSKKGQNVFPCGIFDKESTQTRKNKITVHVPDYNFFSRVCVLSLSNGKSI